MKKILVVLISIALGMLLASSAMAAPGDGVVGSLHDLAITYPADTADPLARVCIYCHTPHHAYRLSAANGGPGAGIGSGNQAGDDFTYLPLWNHELTIGSFTAYTNGEGPIAGKKASQAMLNGMTIGSSSLLCLSCHDGSIAVNSYGNADQPAASQGGGTGSVIIAQYQIGKDSYLGNHHPIGFSYAQAQADDMGLNVASTVLSPLDGSTIADHLFGPDGNMECATCHSVHNKDNSGESLLWISDENSDFCLVCHDK